MSKETESFERWILNPSRVDFESGRTRRPIRGLRLTSFDKKTGQSIRIIFRSGMYIPKNQKEFDFLDTHIDKVGNGGRNYFDLESNLKLFQGKQAKEINKKLKDVEKENERLRAELEKSKSETKDNSKPEGKK